MEVSISLGLYISERNEGAFKDAFLTFSSTPRMEFLEGNVWERTRQLSMADWGMSTNLEATFDLILNRAVKENVPQSEMPTKILVISDMEFNEATRTGNYHGNPNEYNATAIEMIKEQYSEAGYKMPEIIFWNVNGRLNNVPVTMNEQGAALVSGFSPSILKSILSGEWENPLDLMLETIKNERYEVITTK